MTHAITTLDDTELDAVCGGHGFNFAIGVISVNAIVQKAWNTAVTSGVANAVTQTNVQMASIG